MQSQRELRDPPPPPQPHPHPPLIRLAAASKIITTAKPLHVLFARVITTLRPLVVVSALFFTSNMSADCAFVDPHMHLWDLKEHADTHDRRLLSGVREQALSLHYKEEIEVRSFICYCSS
jgi:hypothetical protein